MKLNNRDIEYLKSYVYAREGYSILEVYMNPFWEFCINLFPKSIAPNMITLIGLVFNVLPTLLVLFYARLDEQPPVWIHLFSGISIFIYQTLDAIDGKQARRLNMSGPLGEIFDHGCDSISTFLLVVLVAAASNSLHSHGLFYAMFYGMLSFYLTQWYTYITGKLYFTTINVTESQLAAIFLCFTSFFFGVEIYEYTVFNTTISTWIIYFISSSFFVMCINMSLRIYMKLIKGPTLYNPSQCLLPAIPALLLVIFGFYSLCFMKTVVQLDMISFLVIYSVSFSILTLKVLAAKATGTRVSPTNSSLIFPLIYLLNGWFGIMLQDLYLVILAIASVAYWILEFAIICKNFSTALDVPVLIL